MSAKARTCYYTNESFAEDTAHGVVYSLAFVTENQPGYKCAGVFNSLAAAQSAMSIRNTIANVRESDVMDIVASSMRAGKVKQ